MNHFKKRNNKLEKLRGIFFQFGLIIAGGLTLVAFEWTTVISLEIPDSDPFDIEEMGEFPPITFRDMPERPKVKVMPTFVNPEKIEIVDNNVVIDEPTDPVDAVPEFIVDFVEPMSVVPIEVLPFRIVEKMPEFIGGELERKKFLGKHIKYPRLDREAGIEGTVHLQFVINRKGEIKNVEILRGVSPLMDREAIRVLKAMPNWSPGKQRGKPVKVILTMPIKFELR